jgi:ATP-dependent RNA helicase RhlE
VGRTARAATTGFAITFINPSDQRKFKKIEDLIGSEIKKAELPTSFGAVPEYNPEKQEVKPGFKSFRNGKKSFHTK